MSVIDIIVIALVGFGAVRGFFKGLFVELASLVALVAGVYGAIHFSFYTADILKNKLGIESDHLPLIAFTLTFIIVLFSIILAGKALTKIASFAALGLLNKLLGALFGAIKFCAIACVLLVIFQFINSIIPMIDQEEINKSKIYQPAQEILPKVYPNFKEDLNKKKEEFI